MTNTKLLKMHTSPHIVAKNSTRQIMGDVLIALVPAAAAGIYFFGIYSIAVIAVTVLSCAATEYFYCFLRKKPQTVKDLSSLVTGVILALNMPPSVPLYICVIGGVFAIFFVKLLFGGLGKNFANPAAAARVFLLLAYSSIMTNFSTGALFTQPTYLSGGILNSEFLGLKGMSAVNMQLFIGTVGGTIGEVSKLAILIGLIYLLARKVIGFIIPLSVIVSSAFFAFVFGGDASEILPQLLSGGLVFGAVFMATDYSTSPMTTPGKILFGIGVGLFTMLIRFYGSYEEGISFAIIIMNLTVPVIDRHVLPVRFGQKKKPIIQIISFVLLAVMALYTVIGGGVWAAKHSKGAQNSTVTVIKGAENV